MSKDNSVRVREPSLAEDRSSDRIKRSIQSSRRSRRQEDVDIGKMARSEAKKLTREFSKSLDDIVREISA